MADCEVGQKVLIKTSYRGSDGQLILAGRPGVIVGIDSGYWSSYKVEVQMPDGPYVVAMRRSTQAQGGFLLDTPKSRARYPVPNWEQIDLAELHWPKQMVPVAMRVRVDAFGGFMDNIAKACGGIDTAEAGIGNVTHASHQWGSLEYAPEGKVKSYIFPSERRAKDFWELLRWIQWYGKMNYGTGIKKGHNLLLQLSQGELTVDMLDRRAAEESRLQPYEQHVWGD